MALKQDNHDKNKYSHLQHSWLVAIIIMKVSLVGNLILFVKIDYDLQSLIVKHGINC